MAQNTKIFTSPQYFPPQHRTHPRVNARKDFRCRAGDDRQNNFDQFMQWGANIIKKTLIAEPREDKSKAPQPARQRPEAPEESLAESGVDADGDSVPFASASEASSAKLAEGDDQGESPSDSAGDGLDERREQYKHLVAAGAEITREWPPVGTSTWQDWLQKMQATEEMQEEVFHNKIELDAAIADENYELAASLNKELQSLLKSDQVATMYQEYQAALEVEDYATAAKLSEDGYMWLPGWWRVADSDAKIPNHLMCIIPAYNRLVFKTFTPQDLASLYGATAAPDQANMIFKKDLQELTTPARPIREHLWQCGETVAMMHFERLAAPGQDVSEEPRGRWQSLLCANVAVDDSEGDPGDPNSGSMSVALKTDATMSSEGVETSLEDFVSKLRGEATVETTVNYKVMEVSDENEMESFKWSLKEAASDSSSDDVTHEWGTRIALPAQLTKFGKDNDRMMLRIPAAPGTVEVTESVNFPRSAEELLGNAEIVPLKFDGGKDPSTEEIMERIGDALKARSKDGNLGKLAAIFDLQPGKAEKNSERLQEHLKNVVGDEGGEVTKHLKRLADALQRQSTTPQAEQGLTGTISYKRLHLEQSTTDPFTGLFAAHFGVHGFEILHLQRSIGEDKETYIEATKITGDSNVPAGSLAFKVPIGSKHVNAGGLMFGSAMATMDVYKGQGRVARANNVDARWVDGVLMHFKTPNAYSRGAHLGFQYNVSQQNQAMVLLSRLQLDDLGTRQPIPLGC